FEFIREPAQSFPLIFGWMTMGQVLCVIMVFSGILLLYFVRIGFVKKYF
ncbi:MAG: prolipoprotein diacylglyceryl transferase, partial [Thermodesulfobacterium geofontis]